MSSTLIPVDTNVRYATFMKKQLYDTLIFKGWSREKAKTVRGYYIFFMSGIALYAQVIYAPETMYYLNPHIRIAKIIYKSYYDRIETLLEIFPEENIIKTFIMWNMEMRMKDPQRIPISSLNKKTCRDSLQRDLNKFFLFFRRLRILKLIPIYKAILDTILPIPEEIAIDITTYL